VKEEHQVSEVTIERYVQRKLADEELRSFEEHLLECPECFEEVQIMERYMAGLRNAAQSGLLDSASGERPMHWSVLALAAALVVVLIGGGLWIASLRQSLDQFREARETLTRQLAQAKLTTALPAEIAPESLPIAVLQANRTGGGESILKLPISAREIALWMDVEPDGRYKTFAVDLADDQGHTVESVHGVTRNAEGALAVILPAAKTPPGAYDVRLSSEAPERLLAQYKLRIAVP
jgi:Putative zinc-finger